MKTMKSHAGRCQKRGAPWCAVLLFLFLFSACGKESPPAYSSLPEAESSSSSASSAKEESTPQEETKGEAFPAGMIGNPLTGLALEAVYEGVRPVAIMINNIDVAQPLVGVSDADIIFECLVEGGITRLLAVFMNPFETETIGSVRSARPYYVDLARGLDAYYLHAGGSPAALDYLNTGVVDSFNLDGNSAVSAWRDAWRESNLGYEHSLVTSGANIQAGLESAGFRDQIGYEWKQSFGETSQVSKGKAAQNLTVHFSNYKETQFTYDAEKETYLVSQFGSPQIDSNTEKQITRENVLVLYINAYPVDEKGRMGYDLVGSGNGYYLSHGKYIELQWTKESLDAPFVYYVSDDEELIMLPGRQYVCCVPLDAAVDFSS